MIKFRIDTVNGRNLGTVKMTGTRHRRNGKRYYDAVYKDKNTTHRARVLQAYEDGALTLISKATKALEKARREFYSFPADRISLVANREGGAACVESEEDMAGDKTKGAGNMMLVVFPEDIPERYRKYVMKWMTGQGCPIVRGRQAIYIGDFRRWLDKNFGSVVDD